jgi:hypothetical protein
MIEFGNVLVTPCHTVYVLSILGTHEKDEHDMKIFLCY